LEKLGILNTMDGFTLLGTSCKRINKVINKNNLKNMEVSPKMCLNVDLDLIYKKLVEGYLARFSNKNSFIPKGTSNNFIINLSHENILKLYNLKVMELLDYYSFVSNSHSLRNII
jgi:hypothetical protein